MLPRAGGDAEYLRAAYGERAAGGAYQGGGADAADAAPGGPASARQQSMCTAVSATG